VYGVVNQKLMPKVTTRAHRAAVSQILEINGSWEAPKVRGFDVDALIAHFRTVSALSLTSLRTFQSRFGLALASYRSYLQNPG
jgi:hypothetical protein